MPTPKSLARAASLGAVGGQESAYKAAEKARPADDLLAATLRGAARRGEPRLRARGRAPLLDRRARRARRLHVVACAELPRGVIVVSGLRRLASDARRPPLPGYAVRRFAIDEMTPWLRARAGDLELVSEGRVPRFRLSGRPVRLTFSLSHHGRFVAFACAVGGVSVRASA